MIEEMMGEQPVENFTESENDASMQIEEVAQQKSDDGSPLNKFKNFSELEKAYVSLEKEFTKKCQALKNLKEQGDNTVQEDLVPLYVQEGWSEKVKDFFNQNPQAKKFTAEISNVLVSDKVLASSQNSLDLAFQKVKADKFKTDEEKINDENFINEFVLKNEKIKEKIINNYLSQVASNKVTPLMSNNSGSNVMVTPKSKPVSLKEAGDYMLAMINNK